jgi:hypothetical protein
VLGKWMALDAKSAPIYAAVDRARNASRVMTANSFPTGDMAEAGGDMPLIEVSPSGAMAGPKCNRAKPCSWPQRLLGPD